jgi:hypothetical protein
LLNIVHQYLQTAIHAAVIDIKAETADFERFAATLVLAGLDAGIELMQDLVIASEQRSIEHLRVSEIERRSRDFAIITMLWDCDSSFSNCRSELSSCPSGIDTSLVRAAKPGAEALIR